MKNKKFPGFREVIEGIDTLFCCLPVPCRLNFAIHVLPISAYSALGRPEACKESTSLALALETKLPWWIR